MKQKSFDFKEFLLAVAKCLGYYGVFFLLNAVVAAVYGMMIGVSGSVEDTERLIMENSLLLTLIIDSSFLLIVSMFYNNKGRGSTFGERVQVAPVNSKATPYIFSLAICAILTVQVINIIPFPTSWIEMASDNSDAIISADPFVRLLIIVVIAPVTEEVLFRGLMLGALAKTCPKWLAIIGTSLAFGLVHGHPIGIIYASVLGILLGWLFVKTRSIIAPVLFHTVYNFASLFFPVPTTFIAVVLVVVLGVAIGGVCIAYISKLPVYEKKADNNDDSKGLQ